jgi:hypothetical protein
MDRSKSMTWLLPVLAGLDDAEIDRMYQNLEKGFHRSDANILIWLILILLVVAFTCFIKAQ